MVAPRQDGAVAEGGAQPCMTAGVEGEARCVRAGGGGGRRRRGSEEDGEGEEEDGHSREGGQRPPPPQFAQLEGDAAAGETVDGNASAAPSPLPAWCGGAQWEYM